jgi:hypothetical protein
LRGRGVAAARPPPVGSGDEGGYSDQKTLP